MIMTRAAAWCWVAALFLAAAAVRGDDGWMYGRATFYGNEPWYWSIHDGSCSHSYIWPDQSTGWNVAALADTFPSYAGSCGGCFEVKCSNGNFRDGYGADLSRDGICKDGSVVIKVTDTCPCNYPNNWYSNKRWCCGDMPHFDLSVWAFERIADTHWGVIMVQYRPVSCDTWSSALPASNPTLPDFPSVGEAQGRKDDLDWWKYFPKGGLTSHRDGQVYQISTDDFLKKIGKE